MVGPAGFEPTDGGVKVLCLTAWLRPRKRKDRAARTVRSLVGCLERFELSASRATIWRANQLRHRHHRMRPKGLEPLAHCLEGSCSIHLSYGRAWVSSCMGTCCVDYNTTAGAVCQALFEKRLRKRGRIRQIFCPCKKCQPRSSITLYSRGSMMLW